MQVYGFSNPKCIKGDELIKGKGFLMLSEYLLAAPFADLKILIKHILFWGELRAEIVTPIDRPPTKMTYRWRTDCLLSEPSLTELRIFFFKHELVI